MKTNLIIAVFLIVLNTAVSATDRENDDKGTVVKVEHNEKDIYNLFYAGNDCRNVSVKIVDEKGVVVFAENIKKYDTFSRPYNFSQLPEGRYTLVVTDKNGAITEAINHRHTAPVIVPSTLNYVNVSALVGKENKYKLTIVDAQDAQASIRIYNEENDLLYEVQESVASNFAKVYDLSNVRGQAVIEVSIDQVVTRFSL